MKKLSIFLLGAIGIMASSCEESIEPSIPQHNPQGPIVTLENVISEKAGVLASSSVLNLENYRDDVTGIPVMTLVKTDNLPKDASVAYKLQLSATEDFAKEVTVDTEAGTPAEDGSIIYYVNADKWNDAHLSLFGKSPKEKPSTIVSPHISSSTAATIVLTQPITMWRKALSRKLASTWDS